MIASIILNICAAKAPAGCAVLFTATVHGMACGRADRRTSAGQSANKRPPSGRAFGSHTWTGRFASLLFLGKLTPPRLLARANFQLGCSPTGKSPAFPRQGAADAHARPARLGAGSDSAPPPWQPITRHGRRRSYRVPS
jgi:hypothetical protein